LRALTKRKKSELVDDLMDPAQADRGVLRQLTARFDVAATSSSAVAATRQVIAGATAFDEREVNRNFAYDHGAYAEVKRNLGRPIGTGPLRPAMMLALELMKRGSCKVGMSDEGLMTEGIESGLKVVLDALKECDLPAVEVIAWCSGMLEGDSVFFIAGGPLESLRKHSQAVVAR
jgi:hypothetical protein